MKQTLKYQVKKVDMDGVHFVITEQSHGGKAFGNCGAFLAKNGFRIESAGHPYFQFGSTGTLYVRGTNITAHNNIVIVPYEKVKAIFQAIAEFNETDFADADEGRKSIAKQEFSKLLAQVQNIDNQMSAMIKANPDLAKEFMDMFLKALEEAMAGLGKK